MVGQDTGIREGLAEEVVDQENGGVKVKSRDIDLIREGGELGFNAGVRGSTGG